MVSKLPYVRHIRKKLHREVDYIIVGQGIAGSVLSTKLIDRGYKVLVFDLPDQNMSSRVAAGIYNPITGRRMIKTWKAEQLWPSLFDYYSREEKKLKKQFLIPLKHYRPFRTVAEINDLHGRSSENGYQDFIDTIHTKSKYPSIVNDEYGGVELKQSGYLDIPAFLDSTRKYLQAEESYHDGKFDSSKIEGDNQSIKYGDVVTRYIIFCDGWNDSQNQWFDFLPFRPVKGELLQIEVDSKLDRIFNRGVFVLPKTESLAVVGSTYEREDLHSGPSAKGKEYLVSRLKELLKIPFTITRHYSGVRPSTLDRRPFLGTSPLNSRIAILNGLGTKGVSLAPYFADQLINFLEGKEEIDSEVDIQRYQ